jgi:hypothetical protein
MTDQNAAVEETPASESDALGAIYDKLTAESPIVEEEEPQAPVEPEPKAAEVVSEPVTKRPRTCPRR